MRDEVKILHIRYCQRALLCAIKHFNLALKTLTKKKGEEKKNVLNRGKRFNLLKNLKYS